MDTRAHKHAADAWPDSFSQGIESKTVNLTGLNLRREPLLSKCLSPATSQTK